jgi:hypothetical protein
VSLSQRLKLALKAARELGIQQIGLYSYYQFGLRSGLFRHMTPSQEPLVYQPIRAYEISPGLVKIPKREALVKVIGDSAPALLAEANDLDKGKVRLFGGPPLDLNLLVPLPLEHWTKIAQDQSKAGIEDIKYLWEPARFTWVYTLARAYILSEDEGYVETFWSEFEAFADINLTNLGPNWVSGQEVAFRLIAFSFVYQVFGKSNASSPDRINRLSIAIADHAARIPPTLVYARAQNNNHQLSEAAGLLTAGHSLPEHPRAKEWRELGSRWFNQALQTQISSGGTYIQQSTNYHRLMLQIALWVYSIDGSFPERTQERLSAATLWLLALVDPETGRVPNLGHNDGTNLQPLASCSFHDYRPVLQAAALAFLGERYFVPGVWDELSLWLDIKDREPQNSVDQNKRPNSMEIKSFPDSHVMLQNPANESWAFYRVSQYHARPAHADQLHLDLWWRGHNLAQDAGTYLYNSPPPWDNSLAQTGIHNTVTIDGLDQMTRAGRFLWLDWAQAKILQQNTAQDGKSIEVIAQHDGYRQKGLIHRRIVTSDFTGKWLIEDHILPQGNQDFQPGGKDKNTGSSPATKRIYRARLHWLLPDWSWELDEIEDKYRKEIRLRSPQGWINLQIGIEPATQEDSAQQPILQLIRAGESLLDSDPLSPTSGWVSPTYGYKIPALSLAIVMESPLPIVFRSQWDFPQYS